MWPKVMACCLVFLMVFLHGGWGEAGPPAKKDKGKPKSKSQPPTRKERPQARWTYKLTDQEDEQIESGTLLAAGDKLFKGTRQVGTYSTTARDQMKAEITQGKLKGKGELRQTSPRPPTWKGQWVGDDGSKARLTIVFVMD